MKIVQTETLISIGPYAKSAEWKTIRDSAHAAVAACEWPAGSGSFTIYPESGKKRGAGNGVKPIKDAAIKQLVSKPVLGSHWQPELTWPVAGRVKPGNMDAGFLGASGLVCFEWETGNISSSHRSLNKISLGLLKGLIKAGILVVPSQALYPFLTDRIGNIGELEPYFDLWRSIECSDGVFEIIVIEHDATSTSVPRIPKGTDGRALS